MKADIHPPYVEATVACGCGNTFQTRSTKARILVEVCSQCHPFFTGKQKYVDTAGRVEKFNRKWGSLEQRAQKAETKADPKKAKPKRQAGPSAPLSSLPSRKPASPPAPDKAQAAPQVGPPAEVSPPQPPASAES